MSFFAKDSTVTITWSIDVTASPPVKADFDITLVLPNGNATYDNDGITTYIAPTATVRGTVTYDLTLSVVGLYQATLSIGTDAVHIVSAHREIFSVIPPDHVINGRSPCLTQSPAVIPPSVPLWALTGATFNINAIDAGVQSIEINPAGTKILLMGVVGNYDIYELDVTGQDLSTAVNNAVSLDIDAEGDNRNCMRWNGDGSALWTGRQASVATAFLHKYTTPTAFSLTGASYSGVSVLGSVFAGFSNLQRFSFGDSGTKIYVSDPGTSNKIIQYTLTTPYDPAGTVTPDSKEFTLGPSPQVTSWRNHNWNTDGTQFFVEQLSTSGGVTGYAIQIYTVGTAWDISTLVLLETIDVSATTTAGRSFFVGTRNNADDWIVFKHETGDDILTELLLT